MFYDCVSFLCLYNMYSILRLWTGGHLFGFIFKQEMLFSTTQSLENSGHFSRSS